VPLVLGLEEELTGTMVFHWTAQGITCVAFEGGQHDDPRSIDRSEAAIWIALEAAGLLPRSLRAHAEPARALLRASRGEAPQLVEVLYRHRISADDRFRMRPGYASFKRVEEGEELAADSRGAVRSPKAARILMPLYQAQGDDGFFLAVPVPRFWFELSATLRRLRLDRFFALLPGIRRYGDRPDTFLVSRRIAGGSCPSCSTCSDTSGSITASSTTSSRAAPTGSEPDQRSSERVARSASTRRAGRSVISPAMPSADQEASDAGSFSVQT
jgi:succinylglutamate desuccinylase